MAEPQEHKTLSLSEQYALKDKDEKVVAEAKPAEVKEVDSLAATDPEEVVTEKPEEQPAATESTENTSPVAAVEESGDSSPPTISEETAEADPPASEITAAEESSDNAENPPAEEEAQEEAPEIKLETAPADFRFPTTNQTRHCFTRYVEYHRCVAAKGEGAPECDRFQKYYRALCPGEWVERWNEQRENGTFPGPL